jgi:hypothetical protein
MRVPSGKKVIHGREQRIRRSADHGHIAPEHPHAGIARQRIEGDYRHS